MKDKNNKFYPDLFLSSLRLAKFYEFNDKKALSELSFSYCFVVWIVIGGCSPDGFSTRKAQ